MTLSLTKLVYTCQFLLENVQCPTIILNTVNTY